MMPCNPCLKLASLLGLPLLVGLTPQSAAADQPKQHDGFYLRLAGGFTSMVDPAQVDAPNVEVDGTVTGNGVALDVALGGTPAAGLVIGGGIFAAHLPSPKADDMDASVAGLFDFNGDVEFDSFNFALLAPFVDYYPSPRSGLHVTGAIGLGWIGGGDGTLQNSSYVPFQDHAGVGPGFLAGVGYDWWLADQWSLGVAARVTYAAPAGDDDDDTEWQHHLWLPAVLATLTWH